MLLVFSLWLLICHRNAHRILYFHKPSVQSISSKCTINGAIINRLKILNEFLMHVKIQIFIILH